MHEDREAVQLHAPAGATRLVVAVSGRALAVSARRGGHPVIVLDYFADRDTAANAQRAVSVVSPRGLRFDRRALLAVARELAPGADLVYGSGFEGRPALLRDLAAGRRLLGNAPDVIRVVKDPDRLGTLLGRLGIPHPETRRTPPPSRAGWLLKRAGGAGGTHVRPAAGHVPGRGDYFQRHLPGRSYSALFLADGRRSLVLGFNRQWTRTLSPAMPFLFGGAVGGVRLPPRLARTVTGAIGELVRSTGLVGINGIDFLVNGRDWSLLEVNPRPTATMELYDPDYPGGLFALHLAACDGRLPTRARAPRACRALAVVHAPEPGAAGDLAFPAWSRDIPREETCFGAGDPVCTVHATAADPGTAVARVERRRRRIEQLIVWSGSGVTV